MYLVHAKNAGTAQLICTFVNRCIESIISLWLTSVTSKFTDFLLLTDVCQQHISRIFAIDRRMSAATPITVMVGTPFNLCMSYQIECIMRRRMPKWINASHQLSRDARKPGIPTRSDTKPDPGQSLKIARDLKFRI